MTSGGSSDTQIDDRPYGRLETAAALRALHAEYDGQPVWMWLQNSGVHEGELMETIVRSVLDAASEWKKEVDHSGRGRAMSGAPITKA